MLLPADDTPQDATDVSLPPQMGASSLSRRAPTENGIPLDRFNDALRESPGWRDFIQRQGVRLDGSPIRLSDAQRRSLQSELQRAGVQFPKGMEIDPAGNVNQDQKGF